MKCLFSGRLAQFFGVGCTVGLAVAVGSCPGPQFGPVMQTKIAGKAAPAGTPLVDAVFTVHEPNEKLGKGELLAEGRTDAAGKFDVEFDLHRGAALFCVSGGSFADPATGVNVALGNRELCGYLPDVDRQVNVPIHGWSHFAYETAKLKVLEGKSPADAYAEAVSEVKGYIGCASSDFDITLAIPADPTRPQSDATLTDENLSGLVLAGTSQQAAMVSEQLGLSAGARIDPVSFFEAFVSDRADNLLDGRVDDSRIVIQGYELTAASYQGGPLGAAHALRKFVENPERNQTEITVADLADTLSCLSDSKSPLFESGGSSFDTVGPVVVFVKPGVGDTIGKNGGHITATAVDASEIVSFELTGDAVDQIANVRTKLDGTQATLKGEWRPTRDGPLSISAVAVDAYQNKGVKTVKVTVDQSAPEIAIAITSPDGEPVQSPLSGNVIIDVSAADVDDITSMSLVSPELDEDACDLELEAGSLKCHWDTTAAADTNGFWIKVHATDPSENLGIGSLKVSLDNYSEGSICGRAILETPLVGARVEAITFADRQRGEILGKGTTDQNGAYCFPVADTFSGWALVRAFGSTAHYVSGITGDDIFFGPADELTTLVLYTPTSEGTDIKNLQLNAVSTLATHLATVHPLAQNDAIERAFSLWEEHVQADIRYQQPTSLADPSAVRAASTEAQQLLLFHLGLSRWGAESAHQSFNALASHRAMNLFLLDLDNAVLDGLDGVGNPVFAYDAVRVRTDSLRIDLVQACARWLAGEAVETLEVSNETGLSVVMFDDWFTAMAANQSELFLATDVPASPDFLGPEITVSEPSSGALVCDSALVAATVTDQSQLDSVSLSPRPYLKDVGISIAGPSATIGAQLKPTGHADGPKDIEISATDVFGFTTTESVTVVSDTTPPVIAFEGLKDGDTVKGVVNLVAHITDAHGVRNPQFVRITGMGTTTWNPVTGTLRASWDTKGLLDADYSVTVVASDECGHQQEQTVTLEVDNFAEGSSCFFTTLEWPIQGSRLELLAFDGQQRGQLIGSATTDDNGEACVSISDAYAGWVLVRAFEGQYKTIESNDLVNLDGGVELLTLFVYKPSAEGTVVADEKHRLQINAATTLAATYAINSFGWHQLADSHELLMWEMAVDTGYQLVAEHIQPDGSLDIRTQRPATFADTSEAISDQNHNAKRLFLFHVGINRLGAWFVTEANEVTGTLRTHMMLDRCLSDLGGNTVLDGVDGNGVSINAILDRPVTAMDSNTLRHELSRRIGEWLQVSENQDRTSLKLDHYSSPGGWLHHLAMNQSPLFGPDPKPIPFDITPPELTVVIETGRSLLENMVLPGPFNPGPIIVRRNIVASSPITANIYVNDDSGVATLTIEVQSKGDVPSKIIKNPTMEEPVPYKIDIECNQESVIVVTATDLVGNTTTRREVVLCDNQPPTIMVQAASYYPANLIDAKTTDGTSVTYTRPAGYTTIDWSSSAVVKIHKYIGRLHEGKPNPVQLAIRAIDAAGDYSTAPQDLQVTFSYGTGSTSTVHASGSLETSGDEFVLPLTYEALGPTLKQAGEHFIKIEVADMAGKSTSETYRFEMVPYSPPASITCKRANEIENYRLDNGTLGEVYRDVETPFIRAELRYNLDVPPDSPAAHGELLLDIEQPVTSSWVRRLREKKFVGNWRDTDSLCGTLEPSVRCSCYSDQNFLNQAIQPDGSYNLNGHIHAGNDLCINGFKKAKLSVVSFQNFDHGRVRLWRNGNEIEPNLHTGKFALPFEIAGAGVDIVTSLDSPEVRINGTLFDWSKDPGIPGVAPTHEYYVHTLDSSGQDIRLFDRGGSEILAFVGETRPYDILQVLESFIIYGMFPNLTAWHTDVDMIEVDIQLDQSCLADIWYETEL